MKHISVFTVFYVDVKEHSWSY